MASITDYLEPSALEKIATPANLKHGRELAQNDAVEIIELGPLKVIAKVNSGQRRTIEFQTTSEGFVWKCSCTSDRKLFCKHCVAAAQIASDRSTRHTG